MSTQPQLSPLEQLAQAPPQQQAAPASSSGLSPLEQLAQSGPTQNTNPSQGQPTLLPYDPDKFGRYTTAENYPQWASKPPAAGPNLKPGESEAWIGAHLTPRQGLTSAAKAAAPALLAPAAGPVAGAVDAASPFVDAAISHLNSLDKIVKAAKTLGYGTFGLKEAHDLYKTVAGDSKK